MWKRLARFSVALAFLAATLAPEVPHAAVAKPCGEMAMPSPADNYQSSKAAAPVSLDFCCSIGIALTAPLAPISSDRAWMPVHYWVAGNALSGLTIPPDHSPPISRF